MRRALTAVLALLLIFLAGFVAYLAPAFPALMRYGALPRAAAQPLNLVVAGVDAEYDYASAVWPYPAKPEAYDGRTDTMLLAQVRPDGQVRLLSLPRDTWVPVVGWEGGMGKINSANFHGGPEMMVNTVRNFTGVRVDGYVLLSLNALKALTDAVGGVTVDVPIRMKYDDNAGNLHIDLNPGRQRLNGQQAEGFLRFRKDGMGDIGRVARQQSFLTALTARLSSPAGLWHFPQVITALDANTKTDLGRAEVGALLGALMRGPQVSTYTVPGTFGMIRTPAQNLSIWDADEAKLGALLNEQFRDPSDPRSQPVRVM